MLSDCQSVLALGLAAWAAAAATLWWARRKLRRVLAETERYFGARVGDVVAAEHTTAADLGMGEGEQPH